MNTTRAYWNPLNNSILVDWDGKGNLIKEYFTYQNSGWLSIRVGETAARPNAFYMGINRNDPDFESKIDTWVNTYRGLLR